MLLLMDEDVPDSATAFLRSRGHEVMLVRDIFAAGTKDPEIATYGNGLEAIIVTCNHRHFHSLSPRFSKTSRLRFPRLGRISLRCRQTAARGRLELLIERIEYEFQQSQHHADRRMLVTIRDNDFIIER
jgi:predicted nuclease of predicted toxin-antitoxin system